MELWDIYDENKQPTGRTMKRNDWHMKPDEFHLTVLGVIARPDGTFLITKRVMTKAWAPGWWEVSGGAAQAGEDSYEAVLREVKEETGLTLTHWRSRGLLTFIWGNMTEFIHLYTADGWTGEMIQGDACQEGVLEWVPKEKVEQLPIWEGDKIFFKLLNEEHPWFSLKLVYEGDVLRQAVLDGKRVV